MPDDLPRKRARTKRAPERSDVGVVVHSLEKSPNDKRSYRLLYFSSGFQALLVSSDDASKSKAAAALAVDVGHFCDPQRRCEGLAHYLEHMLFMGSERYPGEDYLANFLSKHGGESNASTDATHTIYHFDVSKNELHTALDIFAQMFIAPLLSEDASARELDSIEAEFRETQNSDETRIEQILAHLAPEGHPMRIFGWGNIRSLRNEAMAAGVDINMELRTFFKRHYVARSMRLCVFGLESLDSLELAVLRSFAELLRPSPERFLGRPSAQEAYLSSVGKPLDTMIGPRLLRVRPVEEIHKLILYWQLPPMLQHYRTKPSYYMQHLICHEGPGSLLSWLKRCGFATELTGGVGDDDVENNDHWCFFSLEVILTGEGLKRWQEVICCVMLYLEMLRDAGPQRWVNDELSKTLDMGWRFLEEIEPEDYVQQLAVAMLPSRHISPSDILKANWISPAFDPDSISTLLGQLVLPSCVIVLLSHAYGRASVSTTRSRTALAMQTRPKPNENDEMEEKDTDDDPEGEAELEEEESEEEEKEEDEAEEEKAVDVGGPTHCLLDNMESPNVKDPFFVPSEFTPSVEPRFGTEYWEGRVDELHRLARELDRARRCSGDQSFFEQTRVALRLPDRNNFLASDFQLRPFQGQSHPQRNAAAGSDDKVLLTSYKSFPCVFRGFLALPRRLSPASRVRIFHWQDDQFKTPRLEIGVKLAGTDANLNPCCPESMALLAMLGSCLVDILNEVVYMAEQGSLSCFVLVKPYGLDLRVGGFHHKLPLLLQAVVRECLSLGDVDVWRSNAVDQSFLPRLAAQREKLLRGFRNAYLSPDRQAAAMRLMLVTPWTLPAPTLARALECSGDPATLARFCQHLLPHLQAELLIMGNVTAEDAESILHVLPEKLLARGESEIAASHPLLRVAVLPKSLQGLGPVIWVEDCPDQGNRNCAVELYWQIGLQPVATRVASLLLESIMREPLYDALRTKQQLGYTVDCMARHTRDVVGFSIWLVSSKVKPAEICRRVEEYLVQFRQWLEAMVASDFEKHVVSLAREVLEPAMTLQRSMDAAWEEVTRKDYQFDRPRREAAALSSISQEALLDVLDRFIMRGAPERRLAIVASIGGRMGTSKLFQLEEFGKDYSNCRIVSSQQEFQESATFYESGSSEQA